MLVSYSRRLADFAEADPDFLAIVCGDERMTRGELRAAGSSLDTSLFEPPPTELRQSLKKCAIDCDWQQVLELAETAVAMPCGRGWLDAQRYAFRAATELGYEQIASAIRCELNALLADYPDLPESMLLDDTPAANAETQVWLKEIAPASQSQTGAEYAPAPVTEEADGETDAAGGFQTASGKCEFIVETLDYQPPIESRHGDRALAALKAKYRAEPGVRERLEAYETPIEAHP